MEVELEDELLPHCKTGGRLRNGASHKDKGHAYASAHKKNHNLRSSSEIETKSRSNFEEDQFQRAPFSMENHKRMPNTNQFSPKKLESAKPSPSIIAKLMGLKELPPQKGPEKANTKSSRSHKPTLSGHFNNRNVEFKDVFEVIEERNMKQDKRMNMKDLLKVKEYERDLENYRDSFVKNMEKSNPLFAKHLLDLKCYPPHLHKGMAARLKSGYVNEHVLAKNLKLTNSDQRDNCGHHDHIVVLDPKMGNVDQNPRLRKTIHQNFLENLQSKRDKMWRFEAFGYQGDEYCNRNIKLDKSRRIDSNLNEEGIKSLAEMLAKPDMEKLEKLFDSHKNHRKLLKNKFDTEGYDEKMEGSTAKLPQNFSPIGRKSSLLEREDFMKLKARKQKLRENLPIKGNYSSRNEPRGGSGNGFEMEEKMLFPIDEGHNAGPMNNQLFAGAKKHETEKRASVEEREECFLVMNFNRNTNSSDAEIPSPISVLEPIPIESESSVSSFLKPDSDSYETDTQITGESEVCMSSDDDGQGTKYNSKTSKLNLLRDQEEREFSYMLEMLIQSGVHRMCTGMLKRKYHSREFPVDPRLFDRLEKRYCQMLSWTKSDRKLLFDLVNSVLAIMLAPFLDSHPWVRCDRYVGPTWGPEVLVERVWMILSREREKHTRGNVEEKVLDSNLFENLCDEINVMGKQIERMLIDEMLEEIVLGFV